jgi:hypothetical protein
MDGKVGNIEFPGLGFDFASRNPLVSCSLVPSLPVSDSWTRRIEMQISHIIASAVESIKNPENPRKKL